MLFGPQVILFGLQVMLFGLQVILFGPIALEMSCTCQTVILTEARIIFIQRLVKEFQCLVGHD